MRIVYDYQCLMCGALDQDYLEPVDAAEFRLGYCDCTPKGPVKKRRVYVAVKTGEA